MVARPALAKSSGFLFLALVLFVGACATSRAADGGIGSPCQTNLDCNDGLACNGSETCAGGRCVAGTPLSCDDGIPCTTDSCSESAGCTHLPDNAICGPGNLCDPSAGGCVPAPNCTTNADCDDGVFCNGAETCDARYGCTAGTPPSCGDSVACTTDACDEATRACTHTPNPASCDDGMPCNGTETCDAVLGCQPGTPIVCDDLIPCTVDSCTPSTGMCSFVPNDGACSDGLVCNGTEICSATAGCVPGTPPSCDDTNLCTTDACAEPAGCTHTPISCDDANACTTDLCDAATGCSHPAIVCDDADPCTTDTCDPATGCVFTPITGCMPVCGNTFCEPGETCSTCPADCGPCGPVCPNGICESGETCTTCPADCGACPVCPGPFPGSGSGGNSGATCLATYTFYAIAGNTYTISTCGSYSGDTYVVVSGACTCSNDDSCGLGSQCTCTATTSGAVTICASTFDTVSSTWSYTIAGTCASPPTCGNAVCEPGEDCSSCAADCGACPPCGPFSGSGSNGGSGTRCLATYTFPVTAGGTYTISTCGSYTGDTYVVVSGACSCTNDDSCFLGSQCTCTAASTGTATICASTFSTASASWNYTVTGPGCP